MTKLSIFYSNEADKYFDERYYLEVHIPMSVKLQGTNLKAVQVETAWAHAPEEVQPPYVAICHFYYETPDHFFTAFLPHRDILEKDMEHYTNIKPLIQMSDVRLDSLQGITIQNAQQ